MSTGCTVHLLRRGGQSFEVALIYFLFYTHTLSLSLSPCLSLSLCLSLSTHTHTHAHTHTHMHTHTLSRFCLLDNKQMVTLFPKMLPDVQPNRTCKQGQQAQWVLVALVCVCVCVCVLSMAS